MESLLSIIQSKTLAATTLNRVIKNLRFGEDWSNEKALRDLDFCCDKSRDYVDVIDYVGKICEASIEIGRLRDGRFISTIKFKNKIVLQTEPFPNVSVAVSMSYLMLVYKQQTCDCGGNKYKDCDVPKELCFVKIP